MRHNPAINAAEASAVFVAALSDPGIAALVLAAVAERTGSPVFRSAAGMLRGRNAGGRPMRDDSDALARMAALVADGTAETAEQAARYVARTMPGEHSTDAAAARLARKYRAADKTG